MRQDNTDAIRDLIDRILKDRGKPVRVGDDDPLFSSGLLDSMVAVDLIMRLETQFGVDFSRLDFDVSLIDSVAAINDLTRQNEIT